MSVGAFDLTCRVAIVTGVGSGTGRASSIALAGAGAVVVCADLDHRTASQTAELVQANGGSAVSRRLDVTDAAAVRATVAGVHERYGRLDVMANVAGAVTARGPVATLAETDFDRGLSLNP